MKVTRLCPSVLLIRYWQGKIDALEEKPVECLVYLRPVKTGSELNLDLHGRMPAIKKKVKYFVPIHSSSISERALLFGRF